MKDIRVTTGHIAADYLSYTPHLTDVHSSLIDCSTPTDWTLKFNRRLQPGGKTAVYGW